MAPAAELPDEFTGELIIALPSVGLLVPTG